MGGSSPTDSRAHTKSSYTYLGQDSQTNPLLDMVNKYAELANQAQAEQNLLFGGRGYGGSFQSQAQRDFAKANPGQAPPSDNRSAYMDGSQDWQLGEGNLYWGQGAGGQTPDLTPIGSGGGGGTTPVEQPVIPGSNPSQPLGAAQPPTEPDPTAPGIPVWGGQLGTGGPYPTVPGGQLTGGTNTLTVPGYSGLATAPPQVQQQSDADRLKGYLNRKGGLQNASQAETDDYWKLMKGVNSYDWWKANNANADASVDAFMKGTLGGYKGVNDWGSASGSGVVGNDIAQNLLKATGGNVDAAVKHANAMLSAQGKDPWYALANAKGNPSLDLANSYRAQYGDPTTTWNPQAAQMQQAMAMSYPTLAVDEKSGGVQQPGVGSLGTVGVQQPGVNATQAHPGLPPANEKDGEILTPEERRKGNFFTTPKPTANAGVTGGPNGYLYKDIPGIDSGLYVPEGKHNDEDYARPSAVRQQGNNYNDAWSTAVNWRPEAPTGGLYGGYEDLASGRNTDVENVVGRTYAGLMQEGGYSRAAKDAMQQQAAAALQAQMGSARDAIARRGAVTGNSAGAYGALAKLGGTGAQAMANQTRQNVIDWENKRKEDQQFGLTGLNQWTQQGRKRQAEGLAGQQQLMNAANAKAAGYYGAMRDVLGTKQEDSGQAYQVELV